MPQGPHPNHVDLAASLEALREDVKALRTELQPVSDAYKAMTIGARVLKWAVGVLAGLGAVWTFCQTFHSGAPK